MTQHLYSALDQNTFYRSGRCFASLPSAPVLKGALALMLCTFCLYLGQLRAQVLHNTSCASNSTSFTLDWDASPSGSQVNWTPQGNTTLSITNFDGATTATSYNATVTVSGATASLDTENSINTPGVTNSLSGGADALHISSSGLGADDFLEVHFAFSPSLAGQVSFDLYNVIEQFISGPDPGQNVMIYATNSSGALMVPELVGNGSESWDLDGPGVADGNTNSTAGTNDQVGVNIRSIDDISDLYIRLRPCSSCDSVDNTEFAIGDIDICLIADTDQDGIDDFTDQDDDNDGISDRIELCPNPTQYTFDWDNYNWGGGASDQFTMPDGTVMTASAITNGGTLSDIDIDDDQTGGFGGGQDSWYILADQLRQSQSVDIVLDFSEALDSLSFTIIDVDYASGDFQDSMIIIGYYNGYVVFPTLTASVNNTVSNNRAVGNTATASASGDANILVEFDYPVDSVSIYYGNGVDVPSAPGDQAISIHDLTYLGDCGVTDTDGDGNPDYLDIDADNDGIVDYIEWQASSASPTAPSGSDSDNDGIDNNFEGASAPIDTDGDGVPDFLDPDADNDTELDLVEGWDTDNDGIANTTPSGTDTDGDGLDDNFDNVNGWNSTTNVTNNGQTSSSFPNLDVPGTAERDWREDFDTDGDGIGDNTDLDDDDDGIPDSQEANGNDPSGDEDGDGVPNFVDASQGSGSGDGSTTDYTDSNGDGIPDVYDTDGDGIPNHLDLDSDNDGVLDLYESGISAATLATIDTDGDGIIDGGQTRGTNGLANTLETSADSGTPNYTVADTDGDGLEDLLDLDSDNDGVTDLAESGGGTDANNDGIIDGSTDADFDGIIDSFDSNDGTRGSPNSEATDTDGDGVANFQDLDSDNDGITDLAENGNGTDSNDDGVVDGSDADGDGINDSADSDDGTRGSPGTSPLDTDQDGIDNYLDIDSDNDGITDLRESGTGTDSNNDGIVDGSSDSDGDGILDSSDQSGSFGTSYTPTDTDADGFMNALDIDADDDGIIDNIEAQATSGSPTIPGGSDTDGDGLDNNFESNGLSPVDTDGDGTPDYLDTNSDDDSESDLTEGWDTNGDGTPETVPSGSDTDGDGLDDNFDDVNGWNATTNVTNGGQDALDFPNADGQAAERDWREIIDLDNDGVEDALDNDSDGDGISNVDEGCNLVSGFRDTLDWDVETWSGTGGTFNLSNLDVNWTTTHNAGGSFSMAENTVHSGGNGTAPTGIYTSINYDDTTERSTFVIDLSAYVDTISFSLYDIDADISGTQQHTDRISVIGYRNGVAVNPTLTGSTDNNVSGNSVTGTDAAGASTSDGNVDVLFTAPVDSIRMVFACDESTGDENGNPNTQTFTFTDFFFARGQAGSCNQDSDGDGVLDYLDLDSDNDGIPDVVEAGGTDTDGDGIADPTTDEDGDGLDDVYDDNVAISTTYAENGDCSGTTTGYSHDIDFTVATTESNTDVALTFYLRGDFGDESANNEDITVTGEGGTNLGTYDRDDSDNNGYGDCDATPMRFDITITQAQWNSWNDDGTVSLSFTTGSGVNFCTDYSCLDSARVTFTTGTNGTAIGTIDTDGDGVLDHLDLDSDNDGIPDVVESGGTDTDGDGYFDDFATDTDGDGLADDVDGDVGNDGTAENSANALQVTGTDTDNDGLPNSYPTDDADQDGLRDQLDIDSDNDGIPDVVEAGGTADANGYLSGATTDTDGDGFGDGVDGDVGNDGTAENTASALTITGTDTDNDGTPNTYPNDDVDGDGRYNFIDIDADNDGIIDNIEAQATTGSPTQPGGIDGDSDGLDNNFEAGGLSPVDTDSDGTPDYLDTDADGDGYPDLLEGWDTDGDYVANTLPAGTDADNDGLDDNFDNIAGANATTNPSNNGEDANDFPDVTTAAQTTERDWREVNDADGDGITDNTDLDSDNDGVPNTDESGGNDPTGDEDGDGIPNWLDTTDDGNGGDGSTTDYTDTDADGIPDIYDFDRDGIPNHLDKDSDNDGIVDIIEAGGTDVNQDGEVDYPTPGDPTSMTDADSDGLADAIDDVDSGSGGGEVTNGTPLTNPNTDGQGNANMLDIDADDDGIVDNTEAQATGSYITPTGNDTDGDGIDNAYDPDNGGTYITPENTDGLGLADYLDTDSDDDGESDNVEGHDSNGDGTPDAGSPANTGVSGGTTDSDGDGLLDGYDNNTASRDPTNGSLDPSSHPDADEGGAQRDWREVPCSGGDVTLSAQNATTTANSYCVQDGWTYYYNPADSTELLFAIEHMPAGGNTNDFTVSVDLTVSSDPDTEAGVYSSTDAGNEQATFVMGRYWNVSLTSGSLNGAVNIRFYYDTDDADTLEAVAERWNDNNAGSTANVSGRRWFAMTSGTFDHTTADLQATGISGSSELFSASTGTEDGVSYVQFDGLNSLTGGSMAYSIGTNSVILPVELLTFTATEQGREVKLDWATASERNTDRFELERSPDTKVWSKVASVKAAGNSTVELHYEHWDKHPLSGTSYYRLRTIDLDGSSELSQIEAVRFTEAFTTSAQVSIYPNPNSGAFQIRLPSDTDGLALSLFDASGRMLRSWNTRLSDGQETIQVTGLSAGAYVLHIVDGANGIHSLPIIVSH